MSTDMVAQVRGELAHLLRALAAPERVPGLVIAESTARALADLRVASLRVHGDDLRLSITPLGRLWLARWDEEARAELRRDGQCGKLIC